MPKVIHTSAKGLVQSSGTSHPYLDFVNQVTYRLATGAISEANGNTGQAGYDDVALLAADTYTDVSTTGLAASTIYLPAANAGTHVVALLSDHSTGGTASLTVKLQGSTGETARVAAGGTAATFVAGFLRLNQGINAAAANTNNVPIVIADSNHTMVILCGNDTNEAVTVNSLLSFYCIEDGKWLLKLDNVLKGTGNEGAAPVSFS